MDRATAYEAVIVQVRLLLGALEVTKMTNRESLFVVLVAIPFVGIGFAFIVGTLALLMFLY